MVFIGNAPGGDRIARYRPRLMDSSRASLITTQAQYAGRWLNGG
jgi:hypothetical protein